MKNVALLFLLFAVTLFTSCEEDIEKRQVVFTATMPADDLSSSRPGSLVTGITGGNDLSAQWKDGDKIQVFVRQDGKVYQLESPSTIYDIKSDGMTCSFQVTLPKSVDRNHDYDIIGVTGVEAYVDGEDVIALCNMKRMGIEGSNAPLLPMWFTAKRGSSQAKFRHLCAYEVLYVNNISDSSIRFKPAGFDVSTPWYKYSDKIVLTNSSRYEVSHDAQTDAESDEITIAPGGTGTIVTCYIPAFDIIDSTTGEVDLTIDNARLKALVNGETVTTTDAIKSYKVFARGNAYYMQVTWDGSNLWFTNDFCPDGNHPHMIDLGLPSGTKWACCNVGANSPSERGDYFAWGETSPKTAFGEYNYKWYIAGDDHRITKYCSNSDYGIVDNIIGLQLEDDAAYVNWGPEWRMPGSAQTNELLNNCTYEWTKVNGMNGYLFKSNINNNAIFFPANGWYNNHGLQGLDDDGSCWIRFNAYISYPNIAYILCFRYGNMGWINIVGLARHNGAGVRAVYVGQE